MHHQKLGARAEYRRQEAQRVSDSPTITRNFRAVKTLTINLSHYEPTGTVRTSHFKYMVNINNAKSVLRFDCPNHECIRGDFDLSKQLAEAIAKGKTEAEGEVLCQGRRSKTAADGVLCHNILRYKFILGY